MSGLLRQHSVMASLPEVVVWVRLLWQQLIKYMLLMPRVQNFFVYFFCLLDNTYFPWQMKLNYNLVGDTILCNLYAAVYMFITPYFCLYIYCKIVHKVQVEEKLRKNKIKDKKVSYLKNKKITCQILNIKNS